MNMIVEQIVDAGTDLLREINEIDEILIRGGLTALAECQYIKMRHEPHRLLRLQGKSEGGVPWLDEDFRASTARVLR